MAGIPIPLKKFGKVEPSTCIIVIYPSPIKDEKVTEHFSHGHGVVWCTRNIIPPKDHMIETQDNKMHARWKISYETLELPRVSGTKARADKRFGIGKKFLAKFHGPRRSHRDDLGILFSHQLRFIKNGRVVGVGVRLA